MEQESNSVHFPLKNPNTFKTHSTAIDDDRHERIISNLKASIFAKINPSITILPQLNAHIEQRLLQFFPSFHTPSHPPYSSMIQSAILELNDEEGSTEEAVSGFIRRKYKDLPWGHESFVKHHLIKLCGNKEIACVKGRYLLLVKDCDHKEIKGSSRKKQGCRGKQRRNQGRVKKMQKQIQREKKQIEVFEESRDLEMLPVEVTELKIKAPGQQNYSLTDNNYKPIITKLKKLVFEMATNSSKTIATEVKSNIEQRLQEFFPNFHTLTHPPYATMIQQAILELNQEGWLNEEEISAFIKREFKLVHESFLHRPLEKLCRSWNLVHTNDGQCMLLDKNSEFSDPMGEGMKKQWHGGRQCGDQDRVLPEEQSEVICEESLSLKPEVGKQTKPEGQLIEVFEGPSDLEKQNATVTEQRSDAIEVSEEDKECGRETITEERWLQGKKAELIPSEIKEQINVLDEQNEAERTEIEMTEQVEETPHAMELKQHKDQMATLERDVGKMTFNKQPEGQSFVSATNSFDMCMESVKKTKRFEEPLLGFSLSLRGMKESNSVTGKRKECLKEQQMQTQTSCSECVENLEMKSNIEVTEVQKQPQKQEEEVIWEHSHPQGQHIDVITKVSVSCCDGVECRESEEKRLQTKSPRELRELVSGAARQHPQLKNFTGQQMAAKSHPVELSSFLELQADQEQHLDLSSMEQSPKPETNVNKNITISSPSDPHHQYEQQPPKRRGRGRPPRLKPDANMITKSLLPSNDHGCNEQQQQLEGEGKGKCPAPNLVADATITLSSCTHDQNHNEKQQLQSRRKGMPRRRKRNRIYK